MPATAIDYTEACADIVELVFATMLDLSVTAIPVDAAVPDTLLTAAVYYAGAWRGAVLLECSESDACILTERLMRVPRPTRVDDDVWDSLSEIVNMVGGNLKPVLPSGIALSMPSVIEGRHYALRLSAVRVLSRRAFRFGGDPAWVTVVEMPETEKEPG